MNKETGCVEIMLNDFLNAKDGSVLVKKGKKWQAVDKKEYLKEINDELGNIQSELVPLINVNEALRAEKEKNARLLDTLTKLVAYLVYERSIDNGVNSEQVKEQDLYKKVLCNKDLPLDLENLIKEIEKGASK